MSTYEFEEHIVKLQPGMYAAAYSLTAAPEDAKDLVQDTILRAFTNLHRFVDHSNFKGWIHTIMRNLYISNYHRAKHRTVTIDYNDETPHPAVYNETPHDMPHGAVVSHDLDVALSTFEDDFREPFSLFLKGYKYAEIAELFEIPIGTVKSRIFYVRQRLQKLLKSYR